MEKLSAILGTLTLTLQNPSHLQQVRREARDSAPSARLLYVGECTYTRDRL